MKNPDTQLIKTFSCLKREKVLVVGDFVLDTYTIGKARRISPEAPVPILQVHEEKSLPGMAGNVILNLISMGFDPIAVGRVGDDLYGKMLAHTLQQEGVDLRGLFVDPSVKTGVKNRIIADNQQMIRVDHEKIYPLSDELEKKILEKMPELLEGVKVVALSDYGKGFLSKSLIQGVIKCAHAKGIWVIADPKGLDFSVYRGVDLIKPNQKEAYEAASLPSSSSLDEVAHKILGISQAQHLMITRSEAGIALYNAKGERQDFPVKAKEVKDVTGAGDTVLAMVTGALASDLSLADAAKLANLAASLAIEHVGCARISLSDLALRLLTEENYNKIFDEEHFQTLSHAFPGYATFDMTHEKEINFELFKKIQSLKLNSRHLVVNLPRPSHSLAPLLSSLREVDLIVLKDV